MQYLDTFKVGYMQANTVLGYSNATTKVRKVMDASKALCKF